MHKDEQIIAPEAMVPNQKYIGSQRLHSCGFVSVPFHSKPTNIGPYSYIDKRQQEIAFRPHILSAAFVIRFNVS